MSGDHGDVVRFLEFSISAIFGNHGNFGNLACSPLPASFSQMPTPIDVLLQTKAEVQFDRAVTARSKSLFSVFQRSNQATCQSLFASRRRLFGRGSWACFYLPNYQITHLPNSVEIP